MLFAKITKHFSISVSLLLFDFALSCTVFPQLFHFAFRRCLFAVSALFSFIFNHYSLLSSFVLRIFRFQSVSFYALFHIADSVLYLSFEK